jgi:hypothetical protein
MSKLVTGTQGRTQISTHRTCTGLCPSYCKAGSRLGASEKAGTVHRNDKEQLHVAAIQRLGAAVATARRRWTRLRYWLPMRSPGDHRARLGPVRLTIP